MNFAALLTAECCAQRAKQRRPEVSRFVFHLEPNLLDLESELRAGSYRMQPYRTFPVREPKLRRICAAASAASRLTSTAPPVAASPGGGCRSRTAASRCHARMAAGACRSPWATGW